MRSDDRLFRPGEVLAWLEGHPAAPGGVMGDANAVWAIDFRTIQWTQLLSATGAITYESEE